MEIMKNLNQNSNCQQVSEIELIYKIKVKACDRPQVKSSRDTYKIALAS
jgi:DNA repair protein RadC